MELERSGHVFMDLTSYDVALTPLQFRSLTAYDYNGEVLLTIDWIKETYLIQSPSHYNRISRWIAIWKFSWLNFFREFQGSSQLE